MVPSKTQNPGFTVYRMMEQPGTHMLKWHMAAITPLLTERVWTYTYLADYMRENNFI